MADVEGPLVGPVPGHRVVELAQQVGGAGQRLGVRDAAGISDWCSIPSSSAWKDAIIDRMGMPSWYAWTRRAEKDRPSRSRCTPKVIGLLASPGRRK